MTRARKRRGTKGSTDPKRTVPVHKDQKKILLENEKRKKNKKQKIYSTENLPTRLQDEIEEPAPIAELTDIKELTDIEEEPADEEPSPAAAATPKAEQPPPLLPHFTQIAEKLFYRDRAEIAKKIAELWRYSDAETKALLKSLNPNQKEQLEQEIKGLEAQNDPKKNKELLIKTLYVFLLELKSIRASIDADYQSKSRLQKVFAYLRSFFVITGDRALNAEIYKLERVFAKDDPKTLWQRLTGIFMTVLNAISGFFGRLALDARASLSGTTEQYKTSLTYRVTHPFSNRPKLEESPEKDYQSKKPKKT